MEGSSDKLSKYYVEEENLEWDPVVGTKNGLKKRDGIYFPMYIKNLSLIKRIQVRPDDIFVISYPKSGTTWCHELAWLIVNDLDFKEAKCTHYLDRIPFVEHLCSNQALDEFSSPRILKSHLPLQYFPDEIKTHSKVIYAMRDPKDLVVSYYNFAKSHKIDEFTGSFELFVDLFLNGKYSFGPWWDHVDGYTSLENVHVVHYEDMSKVKFNGTKYIFLKAFLL
jgi:hypothetical protein